MADTPKVFPVILSGGSGTRLWPKSRSMYPKQFHNLTSENSLLQETLLRVNDSDKFEKPLIVSNQDHRFMVAEQAADINVELLDIVLEPSGRNTAPAVATAAAIVLSECKKQGRNDGLVLILASDHHMSNPAAFIKAVEVGVPAALTGSICTFGIKPTCPETGYGYLKRTDKEVAPGVFKIDSFKEKPELETAEKYVQDPTYSWNSGMFLFSAKQMLEEMSKYEPSIVPACSAAIAEGRRDLDFLRLDGRHFDKARSISVDFAVMEHTDCAAMIPLDCGWTDVGSWSSLYQTLLPPGESIVVQGDCHHMDTNDCFLSSDGPVVVGIGLQNLCVIASEDAVLVLPMDRCQDVGSMVKQLKTFPHIEEIAAKHLNEYKPWGHMKRIGGGERYNVHQLTIKPGGAISSHQHFQRAEHWVVVSGTASVTYEDKKFILQENQSTFIPLGVPHRLSNPGKTPLIVIEVQSGSYLGKDDIVRFDDQYGRRISPRAGALKKVFAASQVGGAVTPAKSTDFPQLSDADAVRTSTPRPADAASSPTRVAVPLKDPVPKNADVAPPAAAPYSMAATLAAGTLLGVGISLLLRK